MLKSTLYDIINAQLVDGWRKEATAKDEFGCVKKQQESLQTLNEQLSEVQKALLNIYAVATADYWNYICYYTNIKILNLGIKLGMEAAQSFDSDN